jgi:tRNA pseudouridine13 synthase
MQPEALEAALEDLWGIGPWEPLTRQRLWVARPWGFVVAEPRPRLEGSGAWAVYLAARVGLDSRAAASRLARAVGASRYSIQGLKDACAVAYQYVALRSRGEAPSRVVAPRLKAWLMGWRRLPLRVGSHGFNFFRLEVETDGDPEALCSAAYRLAWIPGFYGPQRFGVERPNTHYTGLLALEGRQGRLLEEYSARYPLEPQRPPGRYEALALDAARRSLSPLDAGRAGPRRLRLEALQAYIYNRALSRLLRRLGDPRPAGEHWVTLKCPQGPLRAPAARLPGPWMRPTSPWARVVLEVMTEEGLTPHAWAPARGVLRKAFRPLLYPVCRLRCEPRGAAARIRVALPAGAYATMLLRALGRVDWLRYAECRGHPHEAAAPSSSP